MRGERVEVERRMPEDNFPSAPPCKHPHPHPPKQQAPRSASSRRVLAADFGGGSLLFDFLALAADFGGVFMADGQPAYQR